MGETAMDHVALRRFLSAEFPQVAGDLQIEEAGATGIVVTLRTGTAHLRPGGTVSGPTLFMLADVGVYLALLARVGPEALAVTTSASIDFLRKPEADAPLAAQCEILKLGRRLAVGEARLLSGQGRRLVARASLTYARATD